MHIDIHNIWPQYQLIDSGNSKKLEQFGKHILIRPEPHALHKPALSEKQWNELAHAAFIQKSKATGHWKKFVPMQDMWDVQCDVNKHRLNLELRLSGFKHVGVFPEQFLNWSFVSGMSAEFEGKPELLNLFAYTGVMSLIAARSGFSVTHVEALKQLNQWGKKMMQDNNLDGIRWITDDAMKFVEKEIRRKRNYDVVVMDPPAFGHAPGTKTWKLKRDFLPLVEKINKIMKPRGFLIISLYAQDMDVDDYIMAICRNYGFSLLFVENIKGVSQYNTMVDHGYIVRLRKK
ncbi:MAG: class I SAM-dependent methyltransferase [Candidatus Delongbacteria bacterium]|jgi:23S rRNA (cytosine1962-C5)-methyltransferase|nr:class I SAM-dependent methyltransferase [Candidatus Delongbacteria bacterium]